MKICFLAILHFINFKSSASENVALFSDTKYCDILELSFLLVNGDTKKENVFSLTMRCSSYAFIDLSTATPHFIHYAVVFRGEGRDAGQLKYFHIEISDPSGNFVICGRHSGIQVPLDLGSRVNCQPRPATRTIRLRSYINEGFILSEVEAHSLGEEGLDTLLYRGCFKNFDGVHKTHIRDINACFNSCKTNFSYMAMKDGTQCYCGAGYDTTQEIMASNCTIRCNESTERVCGSSNSFSLYIANFQLPYFEGCYTRSSMTGEPIQGVMSIGKCLRHCDDKKYAFLTAGDKCYCDTDKGSGEETRETCGTSCTGESSMTCGAPGKYSVYKTCYNPETRSLKCSQAFQCDGPWDGFGVCVARKCKPGFVGIHCFNKATLAMINFAKDSMTNYCDQIELTGKLVDGKKNKELSEGSSERCLNHAYIVIDTDKLYFSHYFIIYKGEGPDLGQTDYLLAEILVGRYYSCAEHYMRQFPFNVGIRINCQPVGKRMRYRIKSHINEGLYLSEVEIYYIGDNAEDQWILYRGCFKSVTGEKANDSHIENLNDCAIICQKNSSYLAMIGNECYCVDNFEDEAALSACDNKCHEINKMCGGENRYSVYMVNFRLPYYDGCFKRTDMTEPAIEGDMTPGKCLKHCGLLKFAFLSKGNKCQCSDDKGDSEFQREECTAPCTGDNTKMCGSQSDTIFSTWRGCSNPETKSLKCSDAFMCKGMFDAYGICKDGCIDGFIGQHCLEKNNSPIAEDDSSAFELFKGFIKTYALVIVGVILILCGIIYVLTRSSGSEISSPE